MTQTQLRACDLDVQVALDWGMAVGYVVRGPDGCSGGIRGHGSCNASAAGGDARGVSMGVISRGCHERNGKAGRRGRSGLVDSFLEPVK